MTVYQANAGDNWLHWNGVSDSDTEANNGWMWGIPTDDGEHIEWPGNTDALDMVKNVNIDDINYNLFIATNKNVLPAGKSTAPNLLGFYLDCHVDNDDGQYYYKKAGNEPKPINDFLDADGNLTILVATQAVQTEGFDDAWDALDTAFGDITPDNHPWSGRTDIHGAQEVTVSTAKELQNMLERGGKIKVKLANDIELDEKLVVTGKVTLDMDGKKLTWSPALNDGYAVETIRGSSLTIDGNGTFELDDENYTQKLFFPKGDVIINNGTFRKTKPTVNADSLFESVNWSGSGIPEDQRSKLIINGGYFDGDFYASYDESDCNRNCQMTLNLSDGQYVRVYGGTFVGQNPAWGDQGKATLCPHCNANGSGCQGVFLEGQGVYDTELPAGYTITEGKTTDETNRPTYTVHYNP